MRKQTLWRSLIAAFGFLLLHGGVAQAEIDPATVQKLLSDDGAANDYFGRAVAVDGNTAVIGAYRDDDKGDASGSAYVFVRAADGTWTQQAKLLASDGAAWDQFGSSVALSGNTAVISAVEDDDKGDASGSAYVFIRAADGTWTQQAKLLAQDGAEGDYFGASVAVFDDTAVIGAHLTDDAFGSAYVFIRAADGAWMQQAKLLAQDGEIGDSFGNSVALSGDMAVIGAQWDNDKGLYSGSAYVFVRAADGTWTQQAKLLAQDGAEGDYFGSSVSVSGDTAVIGAFGDADKGYYSGSAYVFVRAADGTWTQQAKLLAQDGAEGDYFGVSVAVSDNTAVIGALLDDDKGDASGSAYMFVRAADGTWSQQEKLTATDGAAGDYFGYSVAVSGDTVIVGATWDDDNGTDSGSAYVFGSGNNNHAPVANAGPNQSAVQGDTVCFDGSGSADADSDPLSYLWTFTAWPAGSTAVLDNPTAENPCITADLPGTYQVSLTVNDGKVDSAPSTASAVAVSRQQAVMMTLEELLETVKELNPATRRERALRDALVSEIRSAIRMARHGHYAAARAALRHVLNITNGCAATGAPDRNDWIKDCTSQATVYPLLQEAIGYLESMR